MTFEATVSMTLSSVFDDLSQLPHRASVLLFIEVFANLDALPQGIFCVDEDGRSFLAGIRAD